MRALHRLLRFVVVLGPVWLGLAAPSLGVPASEGGAALRAGSSGCEHDGERRSEDATRSDERDVERRGSSGGDRGTSSAAGASQRRPYGATVIPLRPRAFEPGELPAAQAFLRVNGSANAHGARA